MDWLRGEFRYSPISGLPNGSGDGLSRPLNIGSCPEGMDALEAGEDILSVAFSISLLE